jgi:hypothetical protein
MTFRFRFVLRSLLVMLVALMVVQKGRADGWDKETVVTFSHPVQVPGEILPAGTYVFKLFDDQSNRQIVQIFTEQKTKLLATIMGIPDYRLVASETPVISFEERPSGSPEAVGSWFYPGDNYGVRFIYPNVRMTLAGNSQPAETSASPIAEKITTPEPPTAEGISAPADASAQHEEERQILALAQERPVQPIEGAPASLPKTAGNFMALPLAGFGLLLAGTTLIRNARRRS